jgi:hypothetical protein
MLRDLRNCGSFARSLSITEHLMPDHARSGEAASSPTYTHPHKPQDSIDTGNGQLNSIRSESLLNQRLEEVVDYVLIAPRRPVMVQKSWNTNVSKIAVGNHIFRS